MNRRYAYRDHEILVCATPSRDDAGWRPEVCVISPRDEWQFVPTHPSVIASDVLKCIEIGRRCGESVIENIALKAGETVRTGPLH
jgi:hypothetical protein